METLRALSPDVVGKMDRSDLCLFMQSIGLSGIGCTPTLKARMNNFVRIELEGFVRGDEVSKLTNFSQVYGYR